MKKSIKDIKGVELSAKQMKGLIGGDNDCPCGRSCGVAGNTGTCRWMAIDHGACHCFARPL